ncbi:MAG: hypothetical protein ACRDGA_12045, partial [Bacteroidota bacterium]
RLRNIEAAEELVDETEDEDKEKEVNGKQRAEDKQPAKIAPNVRQHAMQSTGEQKKAKDLQPTKVRMKKLMSSHRTKSLPKGKRKTK